ncbi:programmed cell death protein 5 [Nematocida major]|uniref:programmed cell death protein 5 n=1 Tax=Nematocida major TaxID=1912982 RepID=UPI002008DE7E|nr:programmed cell death protein 5 [Nematocida major]KAH9386414.1 programmed cell death protein 5 [Nematocida major]
MTKEDERGAQKQNVIEEAVIEMVSAEAWSRLCNLKAVDLERYYKIEQLLYKVYISRNAQKISDKEFLSIMQSTEKPKQTFVYRTRVDLMDDLD